MRLGDLLAGLAAILEVRAGDPLVAARLQGAWDRLRDDGVALRLRSR